MNPGAEPVKNDSVIGPMVFIRLTKAGKNPQYVLRSRGLRTAFISGPIIINHLFAEVPIIPTARNATRLLLSITYAAADDRFERQSHLH